jgi:predicted MPP superfamily phosphohydrolase
VLNRRDFFLNSFSLLAASSSSSLFRDETQALRIKNINLSFSDLPSAFEGFKIGFLSDPHIGDCSSSALLETAVDLCNQAKPDLVILGGDYINSLDQGLNRFFYHYRYSSLNSCQSQTPDFKQSLELGKTYFQKAAEICSRLNPKEGVLAVMGNHDRWNSKENCEAAFKANQIKLLINQEIDIDRNGQILNIVGVDDYSTGLPQIPSSTENFRILVSHNPDFLEEIGSVSGFSLGLCGHTHGGQILIPGIGALFSNIKYSKLIQGLNLTTSGQTVYTSAGIGTSGLPIRINCPPELSILTLNRA